MKEMTKRNPKREIVEGRRAIGYGGIFTPKQGWWWDMLQDNRVSGEITPSEMLDA
jgi:hypothetical protein